MTFRSMSYICHLELLSPDNLLLAIFKSVVENKPEIDDGGVRKDWHYLACKICPWDHAKFSKTFDSRIWLDLFKDF